MKPQPGVWGIDLGQCALKALRLQEVDGQVTAVAFDYVEYPKILSQPDAEPDQLIRDALTTFLSRNSLKGDTVAISVPGQNGLARFVKLPPVEEKKIADIVKFEAKQQIPFNLDEVVWDYQKIGSGNVVDGFALETEIGLFAMKRDMVNRYLGHFKDVGVEVHVIQMAPLALCNFVAYDLLGKGAGDAAEGGKNCVVALDIGADASNLVITDADRIVWQRHVPLGGNHFTRALTKDLKLTFAKAEHLKRNATKSPDLKAILSALKPVLNDFVGEVQRSLGYFSGTHRDAHIQYMVGLGNAFRLPGLQRFLSEKLQLEVRKLGKMERLTGDAVTAAPVYTENVLSFGVAYGLALQGLKKTRLSTNLLPSELRVERLIRAKKPWAVAAAACLVLALGGVVLGDSMDRRPYTHPEVKKAVERSKQAATTAKQKEDAFTAAKSAAQQEEEAVKAIVAGQAERENWMRLLKFVSECVPQPDGSNLPNKAERLPAELSNQYAAIYKRYWETTPKGPRPKGLRLMTGREAYEELRKRQQAGTATAGDDEDKDADALPVGIDDLVQFHIESVDARFCDDLKTFWAGVTKKSEKDNVRPRGHYAKPPEGKGWVVELQGFTYHHEKDTFVRDTLLENIARLGLSPEKLTAAAADDKPGAGGTTAPATGAATTDDKKKDEEAVKEPVRDRISHVVLYKVESSSAGDATSFGILGPTHVAEVLGGGSVPGFGEGGGAGGLKGERGGPGPMPPAGGAGLGAGGESGGKPAGPDRSAWAPLTPGAGVAGGGAGEGVGPAGGKRPAMPGVPGGLPGGIRPPIPGGPKAPPGLSVRPPVPPSGGSGTRVPPRSGEEGVKPKPTTEGNSRHSRTEFVILFVWLEPTPSDALRGHTDAAPATPTTPGGATPPGGGMAMPR